MYPIARPEILSYVPTILRRRTRAGVVSRRLRSRETGGRDRPAPRRLRLSRGGAAARATIVAAIETHVHADFVSGARELAETGARVYTGPGADLEYDHHEVRDGETLAVGDVALTFLHTPGHTWEHICILAEAGGQPARLFTGDLLFVGARRTPGSRRRRADASAGGKALRVARARHVAGRSDRDSSGPRRRVALRRRHRQGSLVDDCARAAAERDAPAQRTVTSSSPPSSPICPRRRHTSRG